MLDLLLRGGQVVDGSGAPARRAEVAVRGDRIEAVGEMEGADARHIWDVTGLTIAPGFIDPHSHADLILVQRPEVVAKLLAGRITQGITTAVIGNCGMGAAPVPPASEPFLRGLNGWMTPSDVPWTWEDLPGYLEELETRDLPLNVGALQAHGPVRLAVMGAGRGRADAGSRSRMRRRVSEAMDGGALGLSCGLIYPPGMYADTDELVELGRTVAEYDGIFTCHLRGSSELLLPAVEELIQVGSEAGCRVHHSHNEAVGREHWGKVEAVLAREDRARQQGVRLTHDLFPYHAAATIMAALFPPSALEGGVSSLLSRLRDPAQREALRRQVEETVPTWPPWEVDGWSHNLVRAVGWDSIRIASAAGCGEDVGRTLSELAEARGRAPFDALSDLMLEHDGNVGQLVFGITGEEGDPGPMETLLSHEAGALCTDAEDLGRGQPHPAAYGAFPRVLGTWVRERGVLSLPEAIRRMTGLPAEIFGLAERGLVQPGWKADLTVFDPETVADRATYEAPRRPPQGIPYVVINGVPVVEEGRYRPAAAGEVLRR